MSASDLAVELLRAAHSDLKALGHMLDPNAFDDSVFGFHAQQAVEKALKAWITTCELTHPFTHDLSLLLHTLDEHGEDVAPWWPLLDLTGYAVRFRYEAMPEDEEPLQREALLSNVRGLISHVGTLIGEH